MNIDAVVFDLDGTLVDSLPDIAASMNAALASFGRGPFSEATYAGWVGGGVTSLAEYALGGGTPDEVASLVAAYRTQYTDERLDRSRPFPGIVELLDALAARGVALGVLSNKADAAAQRIVSSVFPGRFAAVLGQRPEHAPKPDPAGALALCASLGVPPATAALVGDTEIDVGTARAAGMRALAATWGMRPRAVLESAGPYALVDLPRDVLDHLGPRKPRALV